MGETPNGATSATEKTAPRAPSKYIVLARAKGDTGWTQLKGEFEGIGQESAKKNAVLGTLYKDASWKARIEGDGIEVLAVPAGSFKPEPVRVHTPEPSVVVGA